MTNNKFSLLHVQLLYLQIHNINAVNSYISILNEIFTLKYINYIKCCLATHSILYFEVLFSVM